MNIRKVYIIDDFYRDQSAIQQFGEEHLPNLIVEGFIFDKSKQMAPQVKEAVAKAVKNKADLVILDVYFGPVGDASARLGIDIALPLLVQAGLPVIILSALENHEQVLANIHQAQKKGRVLYLSSSQVDSLLHYVKAMMEVEAQDDATHDYGFRYISQDELDRRRWIEDVFDRVSRSYQSKRLELPLVAPASNFLGDIPRPLSQRNSNRLFTSVTRDAAAMAVRYEGTALTAKFVASEIRNNENWNVSRYHYFQEMVRVEPSTELDSKHFRAFYQSGVEFFVGDSSLRYTNIADAIALSIRFMRELGQEPHLRISHVSIVPQMLEPLGLDSFQRRRVIGILEKVRGLREVDAELSSCGIKVEEKKLLLEMASLRGAPLDAGIAFLRESGRSSRDALESIEAINALLSERHIAQYCSFDPNIYRSLDFYSGITLQGDIEGMEECLGGGEFTGLVESFGVLDRVYSFGMAAGVERLLSRVNEPRLKQSMVQNALDLCLHYQQSPTEALRESSLLKGVPLRDPLRTREELESIAATVTESELKSFQLLADRLDRINQEILKNIPEAIVAQNEVSFQWRPIRRVGIYVPLRLPSSAFTFLSAARANGVSELVVYLPQDREGNLDPLSVVAALRYGATVWGGPARYAFPALAFGLGDDQPGCDLVCGPCGTNLNLVKQMSCILAGVSMDMAAGPSTLAVVADQSGDWQQIKLDLVSQLEHGPDSSSQLILVGSEARERWEQTPFASEIKNQPSVRADYVETIEQAANLINKSAPETAEIWMESTAQLLPLIDSCGVVYVRQTSSLGDYGAIGRGCADPTDGLAKSQSGISPLSFFRLQALVEDGTIDPEFRNAASVLAEYERLVNHKKAIDSSGT